MTAGRYMARTAGWTLAAGILAFVVPGHARAQQDLTVEQIFGSGDFSSRSVSVRWMPDGLHWSSVDRDSLDRGELWRVEAETGTREKLISAAELIPAGYSEPLKIEGHTFSADGRRLVYENWDSDMNLYTVDLFSLRVLSQL